MGRIFSGIIAIVLAAMTTASLATAGERNGFTPKAFAAAQAKGESILVDISAPWCPTCAAQKPIIDKFAADPRFKDLVIFVVDFDSQKGALRKFGAQSQSTLIVFKGADEVGRSVGSTDAVVIGALLEKAL